jgi:hypothetical protein
MFQAVASSIGAGLVIGGFLGGVGSLLPSQSPGRSEKEAVKGSYFGGTVGLLVLVFDTIWKHFV